MPDVRVGGEGVMYPAIDVRNAPGYRKLKRLRGPSTRGSRRPALLSRPERHFCSYCGRPAENWDHVEPWSQSHDNTVDNLVPACLSCNRSKGNRSLIVFLALFARGEAW